MKEQLCWLEGADQQLSTWDVSRGGSQRSPHTACEQGLLRDLVPFNVLGKEMTQM